MLAIFNMEAEAYYIAAEQMADKPSVYAWGRTAWRMIREDFQEILGKGNKITAVDLCSSFPILSQIIRENYRNSSVEKARSAIGKLSKCLYLDRPEDRKRLDPNWPDFDLSPDEWKFLRTEILPHDKAGRKLLEAAAIDALYPEPQPENEHFPPSTADDLRERLKEDILENLRTKKEIYEKTTERAKLVGQGRFHTWVHRPTDRTFAECLDKVHTDNIDILLENISEILSRELADDKKTVSIFSLDIEDPNQLNNEEVLKFTFPQDYRDTEFFRRAADNMKRWHVRANVKSLPFATDSISLFSCFEGWPYYFGTDIQEQIEVAREIGRALAPGGVGIFFPWTIKNEGNKGDDSAVFALEVIEGYFLENNFSVEIEEVDKETLMADMGLREKDLTNISEIFQGNGVCRILRIKKPQAAVE